MEPPLYECNLCDANELTEDEFCAHFYRRHSTNNKQLPCPICARDGDSRSDHGTRSWGYSSHLWENHGPSSRKRPPPHPRPSYFYSLVVCQRESDGKFLLVEETGDEGWWLPGGHVDPGEGYKEAARRETLEEAGVHVRLCGIVGMDVVAFRGNCWKQRVIFFARPVDENEATKSVADHDSIRAEWVTWDELNDGRPLRGGEPRKFFRWVMDHPERIASIDILEETHDRRNPGARPGPSHLFSLVICQRESDGKFLLVEECCQQGWWLPGGKVDAGENFSEAGIRETMEEAGIRVRLCGIIAIDLVAFSNRWKQRMIFLARPVDESERPKSVPDYESRGATWIGYDELVADVDQRRKHLRGREPMQFFKMLLDHPQRTADMRILMEFK